MSMHGEFKDPKQGKCVTGRGFTVPIVSIYCCIAIYRAVQCKGVALASAKNLLVENGAGALCRGLPTAYKITL